MQQQSQRANLELGVVAKLQHDVLEREVSQALDGNARDDAEHGKDDEGEEVGEHDGAQQEGCDVTVRSRSRGRGRRGAKQGGRQGGRCRRHCCSTGGGGREARRTEQTMRQPDSAACGKESRRRCRNLEGGEQEEGESNSNTAKDGGTKEVVLEGNESARADAGGERARIPLVGLGLGEWEGWQGDGRGTETGMHRRHVSRTPSRAKSSERLCDYDMIYICGQFASMSHRTQNIVTLRVRADAPQPQTPDRQISSMRLQLAASRRGLLNNVEHPGIPHALCVYAKQALRLREAVDPSCNHPGCLTAARSVACSCMPTVGQRRMAEVRAKINISNTNKCLIIGCCDHHWTSLASLSPPRPPPSLPTRQQTYLSRSFSSFPFIYY